MLYAIIGTVVAAIALYMLGRQHGAKKLEQKIDKQMIETAKHLDAVDANAELIRKGTAARNAADAQDKLDQLAGKKPFDQKGAAVLLADAGVQIVRGHRVK